MNGTVRGEADRSSPPPRSERILRILAPPPRSARHGLAILFLGFGTEAATEVYQFLARGNLVQGPVVYYLTLATTILGFYLMFLGLREWHAFYPNREPAAPTPMRRPWPWFGLSLWVGGTVLTAIASLAFGSGGTDPAPPWIAWPVGGLVVLAFGRFFFGLRREAARLGSPFGNALGWTAFVWSVGVATIAGLVVGERAVDLLSEFVTNWVALIASVGPIVVAMSPLFVAYALTISAFWPSLRSGRRIAM
jgi:hypothetical protein